MKNTGGRHILRITAYYVYLLSGILFFGIPNGGKETFSALIMYLLGTFSAYIAVNICVKVSCCGEEMPALLKGIFTIFGFFICCALFGTYSLEFADFVASISKDYGGARFSRFFVLAVILLALYMGKRREVSFCRSCMLFLPVVILPYIITWFAFLGYKAEVSDLQPVFSLAVYPDYFAKGFGNAAGIFILARALKNNGEYKEEKAETAVAFVLFSVTCILETAKYILWYGASGLSYILRPDMTMLACVPFMNVQEIFIFSYFFAFAVRACVFCTCARHFAENIAAEKIIPPWVYYSGSACILYTFHTAFSEFPVEEWKLITAFFAGIILYYVPQKIKKTHKTSRKA